MGVIIMTYEVYSTKGARIAMDYLERDYERVEDACEVRRLQDGCCACDCDCEVALNAASDAMCCVYQLLAHDGIFSDEDREEIEDAVLWAREAVDQDLCNCIPCWDDFAESVRHLTTIVLYTLDYAEEVV